MKLVRMARAASSLVGRSALLIAALSPSGAGADSPGEKHPFTVHDLLAMQRISDPQSSPDGTRRSSSRSRTTDLDANAGRNDLWVVTPTAAACASSRPTRAATSTGAGPRTGGRSTSSRARSGSSQVWRLALDGGEAMQVSDLSLDVANLELSPDGSRLLAFSLEVFPACGADLACTKRRLDEIGASKSSGQDLRLASSSATGTPGRDGRRNHCS